jgi:hypothetical protein
VRLIAASRRFAERGMVGRAMAAEITNSHL